MSNHHSLLLLLDNVERLADSTKDADSAKHTQHALAILLAEPDAPPGHGARAPEHGQEQPWAAEVKAYCHHARKHVRLQLEADRERAALEAGRALVESTRQIAAARKKTSAQEILSDLTPAQPNYKQLFEAPGVPSRTPPGQVSAEYFVTLHGQAQAAVQQIAARRSPSPKELGLLADLQYLTHHPDSYRQVEAAQKVGLLIGALNGPLL